MTHRKPGRPPKPSTFPRKVYRLRRADPCNPNLCERCGLLPAPGELIRASLRGNRLVHDACVPR